MWFYEYVGAATASGDLYRLMYTVVWAIIIYRRFFVLDELQNRLAQRRLWRMTANETDQWLLN